MTADDPVVALALEAEAHDGVAAFDEAILLTLARHPDRVRRFVTEDGAALLVDEELSLVVRPSARGRGVGTQLAEQAVAAGAARAWSHGDHPAAAALAARFGFRRERELWVMRRGFDTPTLSATRPSGDRWLSSPEGVSKPPPGVVVRPYRPADADELLRVNATAFAEHPEQGAMDSANLADRMSQEWFDPDWLLTAWRTTQESPRGLAMAGFHWLKRHSPTEAEVYVIAVDPATQGQGLGRGLLDAGLALAAAEGATSIHLYVESDNRPAVTLYERNGFTHSPEDTHVQYVR